jgi:peptidoglycan/LPS O-acetylase OafA/YrhL
MRRLGHARLDFLDQLRALAVSCVVISHYRPGVIPGGGLGVGIFFALSGFLIGSILLETEPFSPSAVARFYIRRFMRIYPAYVVAILVAVAVNYFFRPEQLHNVLAALPGLLTFTALPPWLGFSFGILWTLQVEMWFYVTAPIFILLLGRRTGLPVFVLALLVTSQTVSHIYLLRWGAALALGSMISIAWKQSFLDRLPLRPGLLAILCLAGIAALLPFPFAGNAWFWQNMGASACTCGLIVSFLKKPNLPVAPLAAPIGRISYSIYLWHGVVLDFELLSHRLFQHGLYLAVVLLVSTASYFLIEQPFMAAGKLLAQRILVRQTGFNRPSPLPLD